MEWWTIAFNGEIGLFGTTADKRKAERIAETYRANFPRNIYEVVPEDEEEPKRETM